MKVQINSLQALERLIGDDREMEITVKQSIINEFAKSHIKSVANSEASLRLKAEILEEVKKSNYFGLLTPNKSSSTRFSRGWLLSDDLKKKVKIQVEREMDYFISDTIASIREELAKEIRGRLDLMAESVSRSIREEVQKETIDRLVQKKLKDLLDKTEGRDI